MHHFKQVRNLKSEDYTLRRNSHHAQDLFTLGEYLCEESNCLYKMIRLFSYDVPTGEDKRALMALGRNSIDYPNDENT